MDPVLLISINLGIGLVIVVVNRISVRQVMRRELERAVHVQDQTKNTSPLDKTVGSHQSILHKLRTAMFPPKPMLPLKRRPLVEQIAIAGYDVHWMKKSEYTPALFGEGFGNFEKPSLIRGWYSSDDERYYYEPVCRPCKSDIYPLAVSGRVGSLQHEFQGYFCSCCGEGFSLNYSAKGAMIRTRVNIRAVLYPPQNEATPPVAAE